MRVVVHNHLDDLAADMVGIEPKFAKTMPAVVKRSLREGNALARSYARGSSGPHGKNYYKRITAEMTAPLSGEYGPHGTVAGNAVGGGWRSGPQNTDLPRSADTIAPKFAKDAGDALGGLFW